MTDKVAIIHMMGYKPCGDIAFYYTGPIALGEKVQSKYAEFVDGSKPEAGAAMICGNCREPIQMSDLYISPKPIIKSSDAAEH